MRLGRDGPFPGFAIQILVDVVDPDETLIFHGPRRELQKQGRALAITRNWDRSVEWP
jgi:hypothetical protein